MQSFSTCLFLAWLWFDMSLWTEVLWDLWAVKIVLRNWWCVILDHKNHLQARNLWTYSRLTAANYTVKLPEEYSVHQPQLGLSMNHIFDDKLIRLPSIINDDNKSACQGDNVQVDCESSLLQPTFTFPVGSEQLLRQQRRKSGDVV